MFGSMPFPGFYTPMIDERIPLEDRPEKFCHWVSGYFQRGDIKTRSPDAVLTEPSTIRPGDSMFQSRAKVRRTLHNRFSRTVCRCLSKSIRVRTLFPGFKVSFFACGLTAACPITSYWMLEDDIKETGKSVNHISSRCKHFVGFSHVNFRRKNAHCSAIIAPLGIRKRPVLGNAVGAFPVLV